MDVLSDLAASLVLISVDPSEQTQVSIGEGAIYAGDDSLLPSTQDRLKKLGWYYDEELNVFVYRVPTDES